MALPVYVGNYLGLLHSDLAEASLGEVEFGDVSRSEVESELHRRQYYQAREVKRTVPKYSKAEAIRRGVDHALTANRLPTRASRPTGLKPNVWDMVVRDAVIKANQLLKETRVVTSWEVPGIRASIL